MTSLREATIASTNTSGPETIAFDIPASDPGFTGDELVIRIDPASRGEELALGDDGTTIDATTQPGGVPIAVEGSPQSNADGADTGLTITSSGNAVIGLGVRRYVNGILVRGSDNVIEGATATGNRNGVNFAGGGVGTGNVMSGSTLRETTGSALRSSTQARSPWRTARGEGETFVGTATPDANGRFTATLPGGLADQWLTATSTDAAGNTSEFSEAVPVTRR